MKYYFYKTTNGLIPMDQCKPYDKLEIGEEIEIDIKNQSVRTILQNKALHKYFTIIANELNDLGIEYQYIGISGKTFELRYTTDLVKTFIWKPIQLALFNIESTTKINTQQINEIVDVLTKFFGERGVVVEFPSIETLMKNK